MPIKQHPYHVNPAKHEYMCKEVAYMIAHGSVEPIAKVHEAPHVCWYLRLMGPGDSVLILGKLL